MNSIAKLLWLSLAIKLVLAAFLPITSDESYYWLWSHHLQLNYFDHPAMVSWIYLVGQPLENFVSAVRWPGVLLSHATLIVWIYILKDHLGFDERRIKNWLWLALLSPMFGAGALIITPDIPLLFFWSLSLLCFLKLVRRPNWSMAFALGISLGLGLLSKYMIVILPLSLILASVIHANWWRIAVRYLPVMLLGFLLAAAPFFIWNMQNDWISVRFQLNHGLGAKEWKPSWTIEYVLLQILVIFPPLIYLMVKEFKKVPSWVIATSLVPLLFFLNTSFKGYVEANWPIMAYPALIAWAVHSNNVKVQIFTRWFWAAAVAAAFVLVTTQYSPFRKPIKTKEFYEFTDLYPYVETHQPLFARSYQMASRLSFETKKPVYKLRGFNRIDSFDFWEGSLPPKQFFVIFELEEELPESYLSQGYRVISQKPLNERFKLLNVMSK